MSTRTLKLNPDTVTSQQMAELAKLFVLCAAGVITNERETSEVPPLEVIGICTLMLSDAWQEVNGKMQHKREAQK